MSNNAAVDRRIHQSILTFVSPSQSNNLRTQVKVLSTTSDGEVEGRRLGDSGSDASWRKSFLWLSSRELRGDDIVVSDGHSGLVKAL
jgi:transposase-like protein